MPNSVVRINQIALDDKFYVWGSGQDLRKFNGSSWEYYNYLNSSVPSASPYYLDTRSISIDTEEKAWLGVAQGPTAGLNQVAVFWTDTNDVESGESWVFSDLGSFSIPQEVSLIYACPFGDDVLAFVTPLNGVGGTGASGSTRLIGATGGRLFSYYKEINEWIEIAPGYTWPHIYSVQTKGFGGDTYYYYLGTSEGLFIIPQGTLSTEILSNGSVYISQARVYNTHTSGIISDNIYCLDFDENGNLWTGGDDGLSYFDGVQFWNYGVTGGPITVLKTRLNGHVFYAKGDGENGDGTGIWHFNGTTHTQFNSLNSSLINDNVLDIDLIEHNTSESGITLNANSLWVLDVNALSSFNYDIPHVYASSKYAGATGWNFTYYSPTGAGAPLPKVNKYTWTYPEWLVYDNEYLAEKHPGLDPRNLFLTTKLEDISNGIAGEQPYWNNWPIPTFDDNVLSESIQSPDWTNNIVIYGGTGTVSINSSTSQTAYGEIKYYLAGEILPENGYGNVTVQFGYYSDSTPATLSTINPTLNSSSASSTNTLNKGKTGFVVCYSESGNVDSILPFRGTKTEVQSICASPDGNYIYVSGIFDKFIEIGDYVWSAYENLAGLTGATGSPIGVTNQYVVGLTSGAYPWIYNGTTGPAIVNSSWDLSPGSGYAVSSTYLDIEFSNTAIGVTGNWESINKIYVNDVDNSSVNKSSFLDLTLTGECISLIDGSENALYRIDYIDNQTSPGSRLYGITYQKGSTGSVSNYTSGHSFNFIVYKYSMFSYPIVQYLSPSLPDSTAIYVAKIGRDLGNVSSLTGITGGYDYQVRKSYRVNSFRCFPPVTSYPGGTASTVLDSSQYYLNLAVSHSSSSPVQFNTLKNTGGRTDDYQLASSYIGDSASDYFGSYVKLSSSDLSVVDVKNTSGATAGFLIETIKSLETENGFLITGSSSGDFQMMDLNISHPSPSYLKNYPFYLIAGSTGYGITGGIINIGGTSSNYVKRIDSTKDNNSHYYITTVLGEYGQGLTGTYIGNDIVLGGTGENYFYTAKITEQGTTLNLSYNRTYLYDIDMGIDGFEKILDDQLFIAYSVTPGITGYTKGMVKTNYANKNLDYKNLGLYQGDLTFTADKKYNIIASGINTGGATGGTGSLIPVGATSGFFSLIPQYYPSLGINLGNIISKPGSGAWTWCDVHSTDNYMDVPLLSTVIFNNYASNIYGKKNNKWELSDSVTGDVLLTVKYVPYFIYTFTNPGYYTIYNEVEDSFGNVYEVSKKGFIKVTDHKEKRPDDRNPDFVDSSDYGYPAPPFSTRDYNAMKLGKDLMVQEKNILDANRGQFGSAVIIPDNPDATFNG